MMKSSNLPVERHTSFSIYEREMEVDVDLASRDLTSLRSFLVVTADEQSTQMMSLRMALKNSKVTVVFV